MTNDITEDGRSGLLYAYSDGILVYAQDAINGKEYACPLCQCRLHLTHTPKGKPIFVRFAGEIHSNPTCNKNEKTRKNIHSVRSLHWN